MAIDWTALAQPPPPRSLRGEETRQRIILAAAHLFAERGVEAVQPGEILEAAGQRNASAIQYYFGSREGLLVAVLQPRDDVRRPVEEARTAWLDRMLMAGSPPTLEQVVAAWVVPSLMSLATRPGRDLLRVAAQVIRQLPPEQRADQTVPSARRSVALLRQVMGDLPDGIKSERLGAAVTLYISQLAARAHEIERGGSPRLDDETFRDELVAMVAGLLAAPRLGHPVEG
jgi:TetR/AcrR family transcriptional regulator, regulator of cefoperazone and chloramphenicol sensitivity